MMFEPWMLAAMEEEGIVDTKEGQINRVAKQLLQSSDEVIDADEFRSVCYSCGVDPDSFTQDDLNKLQRKLN